MHRLPGTLLFPLLTTALLLPACRAANSVQPAITYNKDIAPLLWEHCAPCHRPGQMAPFSLLEYQDAYSRRSQIVAATTRRAMPPWLPEPGYGVFANVRRLSDADVERISNWVTRGAVEGPESERRTPPAFTEGWQLGTPDLIVELKEPYAVQPGEQDEFRNFVLPLPTNSTRYVRGVEIRPGNRHVIHHATMGIDRTRASRLLDDADPAPGYDGMFSPGAHSPDSHALGWTPGFVPQLDPPERAWRLDPGSDLIVQLHMMRGHLSQPESVRPSVGFYFSNAAPAATPVDIRLGSKTIDIPAGAPAHPVEDTYQLPVDVDVVSVYPHAHFLGKEMKAFATLPNGAVTWLLWIKKWDFNRQDQYRYATPVRLPAGTRITMQFTYDNSDANVRNPNHPPKRVVYGPQSSDEMGDLWLQLLPRTADDAITLGRSFVDNERRKDLAAAEHGLESHPDDPVWIGLVGAYYVEGGRVDEGIVYLRRAIARAPRDPQTRTNLGLALRQKGHLAEAVEQLSRAASLAPANVQIQINLADALQDRGDLAGAIRSLRSALRLDPTSAEVHNNLGVALASSGQIEAAQTEFQRALDIRPDYDDAQKNLALARAERR
jgi:tetratricopeptide (TPR) repeat protein